MNSEEWDTITIKVLSELRDHLQYFVTPISKVIEEDYGRHHGSGSYFRTDGSIFLITNEHVGKALEKGSLAHQFVNSDQVVRLTNQIVAERYPIDVAISKIKPSIWNKYHKDSKAIPINKFATKHDPVQGELLFIIGYSGDRSKFYYGTLLTNGVPYVTQETVFPYDIGDPTFHFALDYKPDRAIYADNNAPVLPTPPGFSGSLVWNSRYVECLKDKREWSPQEACVTGIIWGWPSSDACLLATKVEYLKLKDMCSFAGNIA